MRVLNMGSLNLDKTYSVQNFVQPKETIQALKYEVFCGGKGLNQSIAIARAGTTVCHAGSVGKDGSGLVEYLEQSGVTTDYIKQADAPTGHAIIQVDAKGQNNIIICGGANAEVSREDIDQAVENFCAGDLLLLQNEISNVNYAIERAKQQKMKVVFNPSPINAAIQEYDLSQVDLFILNEVEGQELAGITSQEPMQIMAGLKQRYPMAAFVLTLGEKGAYYFDQERTVYQPAFTVQPVDTTGAGDTFCGYFLAGMTRGLDVQQCLRRASAGAALSVTKKGAAPSIPTKEQVDVFLEKNSGV